MSNVRAFLQSNRGMIAVVFAALTVGIGTGYWMSRGPGSFTAKPDQPIEWKAVQDTPKRTPDAEDRDWQGRVDALDQPESNAAKPTQENVVDSAKLENAD